MFNRTRHGIDVWLEQHEQGKLDDLSTYVESGGKAMQSHVYGGAFDFMDIEEFVSLVLPRKWKLPDSDMLLTKDEEQDIFTIHRIT